MGWSVVEALGSRGEDFERGEYEEVLEFRGDEEDADVDRAMHMHIYIVRWQGRID